MKTLSRWLLGAALLLAGCELSRAAAPVVTNVVAAQRVAVHGIPWR